MDTIEPKPRWATIQVDLDGLDVLLKHYGYEVNDEIDYVLASAIPRFIELFEKWDVKGTFFVVGQDLNVPGKVDLIRELVDAGHEIGNHTMNHPWSLSALAIDVQESEIAEAENACQVKLGIAPIGFRAPGFDIDECTLEILRKRGYLYDSSVLPMPYGPLLRWAKQRVLGGQPESGYLGKLAYGFAPLEPYQPKRGALWRKGEDTCLTEVPVTTMPFTRLPFHASFNLAMRDFGGGNLLFKLGFSSIKRRNMPLNYVFHACELSDVPGDDRLKRHFGLYLPVDERIEVADELVRTIKGDFETTTTRKLVELSR